MLGEIFGEQGLIVLALALILLFGGTKIPQLARSMGQAKKEFSDGLAEGNVDVSPLVPEQTTFRTSSDSATDQQR